MSSDAWTRARPANDFAAVLPLLEKTLDLSREYAEFFAPYAHIADPMIDDLDEFHILSKTLQMSTLVLTKADNALDKFVSEDNAHTCCCVPHGLSAAGFGDDSANASY